MEGTHLRAGQALRSHPLEMGWPCTLRQGCQLLAGADPVVAMQVLEVMVGIGTDGAGPTWERICQLLRRFARALTSS